MCPWNVRFASELKEPTFAAREFLANEGAKTLAEDLLAPSQDEFSAAVRKSPMKRAKLPGLRRNATVVLDSSRPDRPRDDTALDVLQRQGR